MLTREEMTALERSLDTGDIEAFLIYADALEEQGEMLLAQYFREFVLITDIKASMKRWYNRNLVFSWRDIVSLVMTSGVGYATLKNRKDYGIINVIRFTPSGSEVRLWASQVGERQYKMLIAVV